MNLNEESVGEESEQSSSWDKVKRKKGSKRLVLTSDEEDEEDEEARFEQRSKSKSNLKPDKGKSKALPSDLDQHSNAPKTPTLGDLFMDDEDVDPTFDPTSEPPYLEDEPDEYDTIFDTHLSHLDFDSLDSDPPLFPNTKARTPLKPLTTYLIPSSASTSMPLTPGGKEDEPLMLISDLPEDVQDFYLNHWRRGADKSRAGEVDYEDEQREKRDDARRKANATRGRFGRGGFRGRARGRGRAKGKTRGTRR